MHITDHRRKEAMCLWASPHLKTERIGVQVFFSYTKDGTYESTCACLELVFKRQNQMLINPLHWFWNGMTSIQVHSYQKWAQNSQIQNSTFPIKSSCLTPSVLMSQWNQEEWVSVMACWLTERSVNVCQMCKDGVGQKWSIIIVSALNTYLISLGRATQLIPRITIMVLAIHETKIHWRQTGLRWN